MIDYSSLAGDKPNITYDTSSLEAEGFKIRFAVNSENPVYQQTINECKEKNLPYKIVNGEKNQKHIWIKGWQNI